MWLEIAQVVLPTYDPFYIKNPFDEVIKSTTLVAVLTLIEKAFSLQWLFL